MSAKPSHDWMISTSEGSFEHDVFVRSREVLVVVDFWAPWCGPCRTLAPILERLAESYQGKFILVKANTDETPDASSRFNVAGIPAVFAVSDGQIIDFFSGALPEPHVREWLDRVLKADQLRAVQRLEQKSPAIAEASYRELLRETPDNPAAKLGLARVLMALQRYQECEQLVQELDNRGYLDADGQKLKAQLSLHGKRHDDVAARRAAALAQPDDLQVQLQLAESLAGDRQFDEALELLLSLFQRDRKGIGPRAKELMVQIFQALPNDSELVAAYRRKLSMAMY